MSTVSLLGRARLFMSSRQPLLKASLTSGGIMMLGDVLAQKMSEDRRKSLDWRRTLRFGLVGATLHGPYFFTGMRAIDQRFGPSKSLGNVALKTASAQFFLFPPFLVALFGWVGVLEGKSPSQCVDKIKDNFLPAFKFGMFFWPTANMINFRYIAPHQRILYVSSAGMIWNTFISLVNARKIESLMPLEQPVAPLALESKAS